MFRSITLAIPAVLASFAVCVADPVRIGSKNFPESYLLAEIAAQWLEADGVNVERVPGFGGTKLAFEALKGDAIDLYPEYSGTISQNLLKRSDRPSLSDINNELEAMSLNFHAMLGFENTYAIAVRSEFAKSHGLVSIGDLKKNVTARIALSHEFVERNDGWNGLRQHYALSHQASGIEHGLAYQAMANKQIDVTDAYSTDAAIARYDLTVLKDDLSYFPSYQAGWLLRADLDPRIFDRLDLLAGKLDEQAMIKLNARVAIDNASFSAVASEFLNTINGASAEGQASFGSQDLRSKLPAWILRHLQLTLLAVTLATVLGISLALLSFRHRRTRSALLYLAGLFQTIPSIALLALMIPLVGIGFVPALLALLIYAMLPVLRSTLTALAAIDPVYRRVASAMGMTPLQEFTSVLMPLSLPHVLAGIRTATVISIGTATLAAFIGAGGLGEPIVTGLALNDSRMILTGAIPAAILAIVTDLIFDALERRWIPPHLRASQLGP